MLRSMYAGISGMKVNQTKMDVIGNNIANVGTTAFKSQRTRFQDVLSQSEGRALGPSVNLGGVNPRQIGLGVKLAGIDTLVTQGMMQPTSRPYDMAMDGEGYFMVARGPEAFGDKNKINIDSNNHEISSAPNHEIYYTRDGAFGVDHAGNLVTSDGYRVLGYMVNGKNSKDEQVNGMTPGAKDADINYVDADKDPKADQDQLVTLKIPEKIKDKDKDGKDIEVRIISFSVEKNGVIKGVREDGKIAVLGQVAMASFSNPAGMEKCGGNLYQTSPNSGTPIIKSGLGAAEDKDNSKGYGSLLQGMLEMSNVDLSEQFTDMIVTTRAFQASGKMISTGDEILQEIINLKR